LKNLKLIMVALVLCAIPAMAFGQAGAADAVMADTTCPAGVPCYVAPLFTAAGGFVAERAMEDNEKTMTKDEGAVNFALTCGNTIMTGSATVDDKGIARQVFSMDNGMYCDGYGKIEVDNVKPGGWYWVHDDPNSAVSALVDINTLGNSNSVMPTDPGGVMMMAPKGGHGTFVKHEASGRVGILPHVMAIPDADPCGGKDNVSDDCMLKATYSIKLEVGGKDIGASMLRGGTDGSSDVNVTATISGTGYIVTSADVATNPVGATFAVAGPGSTATVTVATPGVSVSADGAATASGTILVEDLTADGERCAATGSDRGDAVQVVVTATASRNTLPALGAKGVSRSFSVMCPALESNAATGQELVPENPFPVN